MIATVRIIQGDCREILKTFAPESVQMVCTSPPYWGLRDYGTAIWEGEQAQCDHLEPQGGPSIKQESSNGTRNIQYRGQCPKCGARRIDSQLGLEPTPEEYVANMIGVFREVARVLRNDGVLFLNLGDSYAGYHGNKNADYDRASSNKNGYFENQRSSTVGISSLKPKDLCGIPWRVAFALQADGWYLRSDIIWHKPNPMPESVTDRPTKAHEYLFLLAKQERYYYNAAAIAEHCSNDGFRNKRSVWTIPTQPFCGISKTDHFATFPEDLVKACILAGSKPGDMILDPFGGSGTVGKVALELGRSATLIELSTDYCELARRRTDVTPGFVFT
jgi:DNA modification methylase